MTAQQNTASIDPASQEHQGTSLRIRLESNVIQLVEQMKALIAAPGNAGRTFRVSQQVFEYFNERHTLLPREPGEMARINALVGTHFDESERAGMTRPCVCQHCGHSMSFSDLVESAVKMGVHTPPELAEILAGSSYYLTVDTDKPRAIRCVRCDEITMAPHCCYANSSYGYA